MKRIAALLLLIGLTGCAGNGQDVEDLDRRVAQLEKKVKSLEQAAKAAGKAAKKGKGKKGEGKKGEEAAKTAKKGGKSDGPVGTVKAEGDASKVVLAQGKKRIELPGKAPAGKYTVMAAFGKSPLVKAGELTVEAKKSVTVTCNNADKSCSVGG